MNQDDVAILKSVQKNTEMAMKAIDTLEPKIYEEEFAYQISRNGLQYSDIHNKAVEKLMEGKAGSYRSSGFQDMMLVGGIHGNTLLNTSTGHMAELMIRGSNTGITDMWKCLNHHKNGGRESMELAKELMDFEEKCIEKYKSYL